MEISQRDALSIRDLEQLAKLAWRNSARCIGRLFWETLELLDARSASSPDEVYEACVQHLIHATNKGRIKSVITVFAETEPEERGIRIWNTQLIRYAGYRAADGSILGDPDQAAFTKRAIEMGWQPPRSDLPLIHCPSSSTSPGIPQNFTSCPRKRSWGCPSPTLNLNGLKNSG